MTLALATTLPGVVLLKSKSHDDNRGRTRKVVTAQVLADAGLEPHVEEVLNVANEVTGTVRGLHYQVPPVAEAKTLWCTSGAVWDVVVDLRENRESYGRWAAFRLSAGDGLALHISAGFAHGYQTVTDNACLAYLVSAPYTPDHQRTLRWNDPTLSISWPLPVTRISDADQQGAPWPPAL